MVPLTDGLCWVSVLGYHAEGGLEVVVDFVDVLVDAPVVQELVDKVVPRVFDHQTTQHLC